MSNGKRSQDFRYKIEGSVLKVIKSGTEDEVLREYNAGSFNEEISTALQVEGFVKKASQESAKFKGAEARLDSYDTTYDRLMRGVFAPESETKAFVDVVFIQALTETVCQGNEDLAKATYRDMVTEKGFSKAAQVRERIEDINSRHPAIGERYTALRAEMDAKREVVEGTAGINLDE